VLGFIQGGKSDQDQFSQEIRLTSPADQFFSYVVGLYYFDQTVDRKFDRSFDLGAGRTEAVADFTVNSLNYAAFAEGVTNISDRMRLITGLRWTYDDLDFEFERTGGTLGAQPQPFFKRDTDEDELTGKLALEWDATDSALLYASYAQGYKGPAFNVGFGSRPDNTDPVDPETSDAYEMGLKSSWLDNRLILNVALFYTEYDDFQASASQFIPDLDEDGNPVDENGDGQDDGVFSFVLDNVGEVETKGVEVDFTALPMENLTLSGGFAYVDAQIKEFKDGGCSFGQSFRGVGYKGQTTCANSPGTQDLDGGDLPSAPEWKLTLAASYWIPLESMPFDLSVNGNYRWQDEVQYLIEQDEYTTQDSFGVLDLSLVVEDKSEHYTVTLFTKNVFDEWYVSSIGSLVNTFTPNGYGHRVPRYSERTFGVEGHYRW
jgi:iron complex outermembrane receptor protein